MLKKEIKKDDWVIVLDFLSHGHHGMERSQPVAQAVGEKYFSLLELIIRDSINPNPEEKIYIGEDKREKVKYIRGRIAVKDLTVAAKDELPIAVEKIVAARPQQFLDFFNKSGPISTRLHQIELLPGVGKKHLWAIIDERKQKLFKSFSELKKRVPLLPDPERMIVKRILDELENKDKYRLFVPRIEKLKDKR